MSYASDDHHNTGLSESDFIREEARHKAEDLVQAAQQLMESAKAEAGKLLADAETRARDLVENATALREAAEREAAAIRAQASHTNGPAGTEPASSDTPDVGTLGRTPLDSDPVLDVPQATDEAERILQNASRKADRMLRVARSEAEARARELITSAQRRIENAEADARKRLETIQREFRDMKRRFQHEELTATSRISELTAEIKRLERILGRTQSAVPARESAIPPHASADRPDRAEGVSGPGPGSAPSPDLVAPRPSAPELEDDEAARVLRSIRRRA